MQPGRANPPNSPDNNALRDRLQFITQRAVIPTLQTALFPLPFAGFHQVFEAARAQHRRFTAFRAPLVSLHSQLVLALP